MIKPFDLILIDPPWEFKTYSDKGKGKSPENHYPILDYEALRGLDIASLAAPNCAMFIWVTWPTIFAQVPGCLEAWGFEYRARAWDWIKLNKNALYNVLNFLQEVKLEPGFFASGWAYERLKEWVESSLYFVGTGYYTRGNGEPCLLAVKNETGPKGGVVRGKAPVSDRGVKSVLVAPVGKHSAKPLEQYDLIDRLYPGRSHRLEIFARERQPGWHTLGNEVNEGLDIREAIDRLKAGQEVPGFEPTDWPE